jgi:hypothetical protein
MKRYVKFDNEGKAYQAPANKSTPNGTIWGYGTEQNEAQLLEDGWLVYTGVLPLSMLEYAGGQIIEHEPAPEEPDEPPTRFTKLEIRRCLRKHGLEETLDQLLAGNETFRKDWTDALNISVEDEMVQNALASGIITESLVEMIQAECTPFTGEA